MQFRKNEEAVSPVIGVILMVAITVILAAVIAAFVFGMGPPKQAPVSSIRATSADTTADYVKLEHQGGADIILKDVKAIADNGTGRVSWTGLNATGTARMTAGDSLYLYTNSSFVGPFLNGNLAAGTDVSGQGASGGLAITGGDEVTITFIDVPSGQQIASVKIRA